MCSTRAETSSKGICFGGETTLQDGNMFAVWKAKETTRGETFSGEMSWGQNEMRLAQEMIWGETTRILYNKIVMCFTHYKINFRQTLELIEDAFRNPWFATIAIAESR